MLLALNPVIFELGPFAIRWYGLFMAISVAAGFYFLLQGGKKLGYHEDFMYNLALLVVLAGIVGSRLVFVLTNWSSYAQASWTIWRVDFGGLSFHGAVIGGALAAWPYIKKKGADFNALADYAVPGLAIGIALVRWANVINQEVMGRFTAGGFQHPAQIYGSAIGVILLVVHIALARRKPPAGYLFWSFALYYTLLRGLIEETFRANPLYLGGWITAWGGGFFTLTQLLTPPLALFAWLMRRRIMARSEAPKSAPSKERRGVRQ